MKSRLKIDHERARREILARYGKPSTDIKAMAFDLGFANRAALIGYAQRMREAGFPVPRRPVVRVEAYQIPSMTRVYAEAIGNLADCGRVSVAADTKAEADAFLALMQEWVSYYRAKRA